MPQDEWRRHYATRTSPPLYPEGFLVRVFLSTFPRPFLRDRIFSGRRVLDVSCGQGRHIGLLVNLGFQVFATEVCPETVCQTAAAFPGADIRPGRNAALPFEDRFFDFVVACNSCYYVDPGRRFADNLAEIARVLRPAGTFVASVPGPEHFIFRNGDLLADGLVVVRTDRTGLRVGDRLWRAESREAVEAALAPWFEHLEIGRLRDEFDEDVRDLFYFSGVRRC